MTFLQRILKTGWQSFKRNALVSSAAILILIVTLSLITGVLLFNVLTTKVLVALQDKVSIGVYFAQNAPENQILQLKADLEQSPGVKSVEYVSRQEALKRFRETHQDDQTITDALDNLGGQNPLPASLTVKTEAIDDYSSTVDFIEASPYASLVDEIDFVRRQDAIENLGEASKNISRTAFILVVLLSVVSFLVSFNTLRLAIYNDRQKIAVMRLVGASNNFVRGPFIVQGVLYGLIAAVFTLFLFAIILQFLDVRIESYFQGLGAMGLANYYSVHWIRFFAIQLSVGILVGVISSIIAIRRYLYV